MVQQKVNGNGIVSQENDEKASKTKKKNVQEEPKASKIKEKKKEKELEKVAQHVEFENGTAQLEPTKKTKKE